MCFKRYLSRGRSLRVASLSLEKFLCWRWEEMYSWGHSLASNPSQQASKASNPNLKSILVSKQVSEYLVVTEFKLYKQLVSELNLELCIWTYLFSEICFSLGWGEWDLDYLCMFEYIENLYKSLNLYVNDMSNCTAARHLKSRHKADNTGLPTVNYITF